jgi:hypothetical protein
VENLETERSHVGEQDEVAAKLAIQELCAEYCHSLDSGRMEEWSRLFTEDGVFEVPAFGWSAQGRAELIPFIQRILPFQIGDFKHLPAAHVINLEPGAGRATAVLDFQFVALSDQEPVVAMVGYYEDEYQADRGVWRFAKRSISPMMVGSALTTALAEKGAL